MNLIKHLLKSKASISSDALNTLNRNLYNHVEFLSTKIGERNSYKFSALDRAYCYIIKTMQQSSFEIKDLSYSYKSVTFHNIVAEKIGTHYPDEIIIIGAHYDTVYNSPGADDNASGIAALLELIRLLDNYKSKRTIRFVAFTLEEPPFFGTPQMGSYVYAQKCKEQQENIITMVSLEMLAYFTDKKNSQKYPHPDMAAQYSNKGNFITIVGNENSKLIAEKVTAGLKSFCAVPALCLIANPAVPGVDLSDHAPFWNAGYRAIMITDTAFYRNHHYHEPSDTIDTLNFEYFSEVVSGLFQSFKQLDMEGV